MGITETYDYRDESGSPLFQAVRTDPKGFRQRHCNGAGKWIWNINGVRLVPYRLPELIEGMQAGRTIFIVEGEKDADRLIAAGMVATCNAMGAGKWNDDYSALLKGAARVVIARDNDQAGRDHGDAVAASLRRVGVADVRILDLPGLPEKGDVSDWLDAGHSIEAFKAHAKQARTVADVASVADVAGGPSFGEFTPLGLAAGDPSAFPVKHLPEVVRSAVTTYQRYGQQPMSMVVSSALACVSFACQGHADVARDEHMKGPVSLNMMPVAESGDRKTTTDKAIGAPIFEFVNEGRKKRVEDEAKFNRDHDIWAERIAALKQKFRQAVTKDTRVQLARQDLDSALLDEPEAPLLPAPMFSDVTREEIARRLSKSMPSAALWDDEGGNVIGSIGMREDSIIGFLATLNKLWDGSHLQADRVSGDNRYAAGKRVTVNVALQKSILDALLDSRGGAARGSGFLARMLISMPESTMGTREYRAPENVSAQLKVFHSTLTKHLETPLQFKDGHRGELDPPILRLSSKAKECWINYYNELEFTLAPGGAFESVRDVASKSAENAARLAALFHIFEGAPTDEEIGDLHMEMGTECAAWFIAEARRILSGYAVPDSIRCARLLLDWLVTAEEHHTRHEGLLSVNQRTISQFGPNKIRLKAERDQAVNTLIEHGYSRLQIIGGQTHVVLNPAALERDL